MRLLSRFVCSVSLACLLAGCIVVEDFGTYWNKGFIDYCVNEIEMSAQDQRPRNPKMKTTLMRSLRLGKHTFLMIRENENDKGGNLIRYEIENKAYVAYRLNESKREAFARDYPHAGVLLTSETATIPVLDAEAAKLLIQVADDDSYWVETRRENYNPTRRSDCVQPLY